MNTSLSSSSPTRALVLAGGGAAGNAWELGVIAGLCDAGVDVTSADLIVGTSAGSTAAAQITSGARPADLYAAIVAEVAPPRTGGASRRPRQSVSAETYLQWSDAIIASAVDAADMRRRMGAAALDDERSTSAGQARWREIVASRLPGAAWARQRVLITAVDARSGEPVVFDAQSGVELVDAVAASTSNGFGPVGAYPIGSGRYLDGGFRRNENADLAAGYDSVLVISPFGGRTRMPREWDMDLATQVAELRSGGSAVVTVFPDASAGDVFNAMAVDPTTRPRAARGGYEQGRALAESIAPLWGGR